MREEGGEHVFQTQQLGLPRHQRNAIDAVHGLKLGQGVEVVQHHFPLFAPPELDDDAQTVLVRFVAQFGNAFDPLFADELGNLFQQPRLVELVGNLGDDDGVLVRVVVLNLGACPNLDAAPRPVR